MRPVALIRGLIPLFGLLAIRAALAHPFHVSLAEMEYDQDADTIEVALRVFPDDLELALRAANDDDDLVLERADDLDARIAGYLRETFVLTRAGAAAPLRWVGMELGVKEAWIYFELLAPGDLDEATLTNRLFFGVRPAQINSVILTVAGESRSYSFTQAEPTQPIVGPHQTTPLAFDVEQRHHSLTLIIRDAAHLSPSQRAAFELLGACAAQFLLHGPDDAQSEDDPSALLDRALELASRERGQGAASGDRARLAMLAARAGRTRVAYNLLAESVASSAERDDAQSVIPQALRAAALLVLRHEHDDLAKEFTAAAEGSLESQILALGRARAYLDDHDHD